MTPDDHDPDHQPEPMPTERALGVLMSLSADRLIAILVIICGILLGVWMFKQ